MASQIRQVGFILGPEEIDHTEKMLIVECRECNPSSSIIHFFHKHDCELD
jgi:hypothetical protein